MSDLLPARVLADLVGPARLPRPAYRHLADAVRRLVVDGRILPGSRLPSERELAAALGVGRITVTSAYQVLQEQGFLVARRGSGSVAALPSTVGRAQGGTGLLPATGGADVLDLTYAATRAPAGIAEAYAQAVEELAGHLAGPGYLALGLAELREQVAARYTRRGLPTTPDEVLVTSGAVTAMAIAVRALVGAGDHVLVETPTYPNTTATLRAARARLHATPVTSQGWDLDGIEALVDRHPLRAAALIPDFHNPTGARMDADGRERLARGLARHDVVALVDETMAEVSFDRELPPLGALHRNSVSIGSTSKTWWGGLRIGWLRAPRPLFDRLLAARMGIDLGAPVVEQLVAARLMERHDGAAPEHLAQLVVQRDVLAGELARLVPGARFAVPDGGLFLWVQVPGIDVERLAHATAARGLAITPGNRFAVVGRLDQWLRLPYSAPEADLRRAVGILASCLGEATATPGQLVRSGADLPVVA